MKEIRPHYLRWHTTKEVAEKLKNDFFANKNNLKAEIISANESKTEYVISVHYDLERVLTTDNIVFNIEIVEDAFKILRFKIVNDDFIKNMVKKKSFDTLLKTWCYGPITGGLHGTRSIGKIIYFIDYLPQEIDTYIFNLLCDKLPVDAN